MKTGIFCMSSLLAIFLLCAGSTQAASEYSPAQMKQMGVFLSNFTELGFMDFEAKDILNEAAPADMIRFGIWHNYINNYKSRIAQCKTADCKWGTLTIDGKYVQESLKHYFDYDLKVLPSLDKGNPAYHYDGRLYHFEGADGEAAWHAKVTRASKAPDGLVTMSGTIYNADNPDDVAGTFTATARPHKWNGKDTWAIVSLKTTRPE